VTTPAGFGRILVPTDFSGCAEAAFVVARRLARPLAAELTLVHVLVEASPFSEGPFSAERVREFYGAMRAWAESELEAWARTARDEGLAAHTALRQGAPHAAIVALAAEARADLIVIGTHGRGALARALLGGVADRVIRLAPCPVVSVRQPE
jgi:nucleotide-binding universal stress UspA family protein